MHVSDSRRTRTEDPVFGTKAMFAPLQAKVPLSVWEYATLNSNTQPERFGASGLAECTTQTVHVSQVAEESFMCENELTKKLFCM